MRDQRSGGSVPVAVHADHYGIKQTEDLPFAKVEIPSIFDAGMTSISMYPPPVVSGSVNQSVPVRNRVL